MSKQTILVISATGETAQRMGRRSQVKFWIGAGIPIVAIGIGWSLHLRGASAASADTQSLLPQVTVSKPLMHEVDTRLGFLGQFSAVDQVELRAQVGGTLTGIHFKDGDIVHKGDLLFTIDSRPYEIMLAQANALLETATARLALAETELSRAQALASK